MSLRYEEETENGERYLVLVGSDAPIKRLEVPERHDGLPVRVIGNHAFASRKELTEAILPSSVTQMRGFAFHDCTALETLTLTDAIDTYYDGGIRLCDNLHDITIHVRTGNYRILRSLLNDSGELLRVRMFLGDAEVRLTFPDYVTVATDNTMARTIQFDISGAGLAYRECVTRDAVNYHAYDSMFNRTVIDDIPTCIDLTLGRLMAPYHLSEDAKCAYRTWLFDHAREVLLQIVRKENRARMKFVLDEGIAAPEDIRAAIHFAADHKKTAMAALLNDALARGGRSEGPAVFSL